MSGHSVRQALPTEVAKSPTSAEVIAGYWTPVGLRNLLRSIVEFWAASRVSLPEIASRLGITQRELEHRYWLNLLRGPRTWPQHEVAALHARARAGDKEAAAFLLVAHRPDHPAVRVLLNAGHLGQSPARSRKTLP